MLDDVVKLKEEVDRLTKKFSEFQDKPYLIKSKDLTKSIVDALKDIFQENKKINLMWSILIISIIGLMMMGFIIWTLFFTIPLQ